VFERFKGLLRDTWWLWIIFLVISIVFIVRVSMIFLVTLPVLVVAFVYYASMRYDDTGKHKGEEQEG
jgi:preprotein translocase subunit SecG